MYYIYDSRIQPFNNENLSELKWLLNEIDRNNDKIIFGIVNPSPLRPDPLDSVNTWPRFKIEYNPLSYWQRYITIKMIIKHLNCQDSIAGIVPMPRPSVNMETAENFLPPKNERKIIVPRILNDALEDTKIEGLESQGENYLEIPAYKFDSKYRIISPELIICLISLNDEIWKQFVPIEILEYLLSINMVEKVQDSFSYHSARKTLNKMYTQMHEPELKNEMEKHFSSHLDNIPQHPNPVDNIPHIK